MFAAVTYYCSKCRAVIPTPQAYCDACHVAEVARIHARDTPPAPCVPDVIRWQPLSRLVRHGWGGRVFRAEKAQQ